LDSGAGLTLDFDEVLDWAASEYLSTALVALPGLLSSYKLFAETQRSDKVLLVILDLCNLVFQIFNGAHLAANQIIGDLLNLVFGLRQFI